MTKVRDGLNMYDVSQRFGIEGWYNGKWNKETGYNFFLESTVYTLKHLLDEADYERRIIEVTCETPTKYDDDDATYEIQHNHTSSTCWWADKEFDDIDDAMKELKRISKEKSYYNYRLAKLNKRILHWNDIMWRIR